jgi:hypothetical protein
MYARDVMHRIIGFWCSRLIVVQVLAGPIIVLTRKFIANNLFRSCFFVTMMQRSLLLLLFVFGCLSIHAQTARYYNSKYQFSLAPPPNASIDSELSNKDGYIAWYSCPKTVCGYFATFGITEVKAMPDTTTEEAVSLFQKDWVRENNAKEFLSGWDQSSNVTILSNDYAAYNGRPGARIKYQMEASNVRFSGEMVVLFVVERQVIVGFNFGSELPFAKNWLELGENAIRSITCYPTAQIPTTEMNSTLAIQASTAEAWEKAVMARWQGKEGWNFVGYTGRDESEVMYFVNVQRRIKTGDSVTIWGKNIPRNPKYYVAQRMAAATPRQKAQVAGLTLSYTHQLFLINCSVKSYRVTQELIYWTNGQQNPGPADGKVEVSSPGSMSEMIIDKACGLD